MDLEHTNQVERPSCRIGDLGMWETPKPRPERTPKCIDQVPFIDQKKGTGMNWYFLINAREESMLLDPLRKPSTTKLCSF